MRSPALCCHGGAVTEGALRLRAGAQAGEDMQDQRGPSPSPSLRRLWMKRVLANTGKPSTALVGTSRLAPLTTGPLCTCDSPTCSFPQKRPHGPSVQEANGCRPHFTNQDAEAVSWRTLLRSPGGHLALLAALGLLFSAIPLTAPPVTSPASPTLSGPDHLLLLHMPTAARPAVQLNA